MPREHVDTLVNLANLRFNQKSWAAASELYQQAVAVSEASFDPILDHSVLLFDAARSERWFERAAYALAKIGNTSQAIAIADEGRLRLLKQRLSGLVTSSPINCQFFGFKPPSSDGRGFSRFLFIDYSLKWTSHEDAHFKDSV